MDAHRWITDLAEHSGPAAIDSVRDYITTRETALSKHLMTAEGPDLYRAQGAFAELQTLRATLSNVLAVNPQETLSV